MAYRIEILTENGWDGGSLAFDWDSMPPQLYWIYLTEAAARKALSELVMAGHDPSRLRVAASV